jgi:hypothetical protein
VRSENFQEDGHSKESTDLVNLISFEQLRRNDALAAEHIVLHVLPRPKSITLAVAAGTSEKKEVDALGTPTADPLSLYINPSFTTVPSRAYKDEGTVSSQDLYMQTHTVNELNTIN